MAGYARVSTDSDDQYASYEAQVDYYTTMIKGKPEWTFVKIYTDEGISGTNTKRREGFNTMVQDALSGKIDLIVTKSVSRFARNTVDSLQTIRKLKEKKVEVYFEKENIWTFDSKGELLITIMSSLAQEESRSISENTKWGRRKRFADGQVTVGYSRFLGYDKGPDGNLVINPEQAKLVRYIFSLFLQGGSLHGICKRLEREGHKTGSGNSTWHISSIRIILTNVKYKGDALLQRYYVADFLTKKPVLNRGEVPQYYVEHNHEAIIQADIFDLVQKELEIRKKQRQTLIRTSPTSNIFSGRIRCGHCSGFFGRKIWHSNSKYRKAVWRCIRKYDDKQHICTAPHLYEDEIKSIFINAVNKLITNKEAIIQDFEAMGDVVFDTSQEEDKLEHVNRDRVEIVKLMEQLAAQNASRVMDQKAYQNQFEDLSARYAKINETATALEEAIQDKKCRKTKTRLFLKTLSKQDSVITDFSETLWNSLLDHITVYSKEDVRVTFRNGEEVSG